MCRLEGRAIYVRWKPSAFVPQPFKVGAARAMIALPANASDGAAAALVLMVPNVLEALAEMVEMGQGLLSGAEPLR